jgi:hypothetical protein
MTIVCQSSDPTGQYWWAPTAPGMAQYANHGHWPMKLCENVTRSGGSFNMLIQEIN